MEEGHFWFEARNELLIVALQKHFGNCRHFLEIGCGTGFVLKGIAQHFPQIRLSGSELFRQGLKFAEQRLPRCELFQMDARDIPFCHEFDVIGAFDVLEHIEDDQTVLAQIHGALKPGGGLIVTVPQHPGLWSAADDYSFHKRRYTRGELLGKVRQAGFQVLQITSFVTLLLPLLVASRLGKRQDVSNFDPEAEFRIGAAVNRMLLAILRLERRMIEIGASLPAGGSLLLVARRQHQECSG
jgi:SAM-dependent methyltransferase